MAGGPDVDATGSDQASAELLVLSATDTVGMARHAVAAGDQLGHGGQVLVARDSIPAGHKVALVDIPAGASVVKFGIDIGTAKQPIRAGDHVHVHNLESTRMRGDL